MTKYFDRLVCASGALLLVCAVGCGGSAEEGPGESIDEARTGRSEPATRAEWRRAIAELDPAAPFELPEVALDAPIADDKIRRGSVLTANHIVGNATVLIATNHDFCTAQVINRRFLLTAAHCIAGMFPSGTDQLGVFFTTGNARVQIYDGEADGMTDPNWSAGERDTDLGLIFLAEGTMGTCHGTLTQCPLTAPVNAMFQFFKPNAARFTRSSYAIVGYGRTGDGEEDWATLRGGTISAIDSGFSSGTQGYLTTVVWTSDNQPRPCGGDSGGPLVIPGMSRLLHLGALSGAPGITGCNQASGFTFYGGMSQTQFSWVINTMLLTRNLLGLQYDCAGSSNATAGLFMFHCDNDGTLY